MRDGWRRVRLGEICTLTKGTTPTRKAVPGDFPLVVTAAAFLSSDTYQFEGEAVCVPLVSSTGHGHASLKRIHYATGRFAVANIITALQAKPDADVNMKFLWLLLDHGRDEIIVPLMKGTANVSLSQRALASAEINLPPLAVQVRVVQLIEILDEALSLTWGLNAAAANLLGQVRQLVSADSDSPLGDLVTMQSGPSWKSWDESKAPTPEHEPVLGITNTPQGGELDLSSRRYVSGIPKSAQRLSENSLVMIRTNGNRARIGNIYRTTPEVEGFAVSAFQIAIQPIDPGDSSFLYWYLGAPDVQESISENASGSTGLGNVAVGWLKKLQVPVLDVASRADYIERCEVVAAVVESSRQKAERLSDLRANLLTALLSGEHEIPESYDELFEESMP